MRITIVKYLIIFFEVLLCHGVLSQSVLKKSHFHLPDHRQSLDFRTISVDDGLSQNLVLFLHQDELGLMWLGTAGGLDRYDGNEVQTIHHIAGLDRQPVYYFSMVAASDSTFWMTTDLGFLHYFPKTNSGQLYGKSLMQTGSYDLHHLYQLRDGTFLAGLTGVGIIHFDPVSGNTQIIKAFSYRDQRFPGEDVVGILEDTHGVVIITYQKIYRYDTVRQEVLSEYQIPAQIKPLTVERLALGKEILVGTESGLMRYDGKELIPIGEDWVTQEGLNTTSIYTIYEDHSGDWWFGAEDKVFRKKSADSQIIRYEHSPIDSRTMGAGIVRKISEDRSGNIWLSVQDHGLCLADIKPPRIQTFLSKQSMQSRLRTSLMLSIYEDSQNNLWLGANSIVKLSSDQTEVTYYEPSKSDKDAPLIRRALLINDTTMFFTSNQKTWLFDVKSDLMTPFRIDGKQLDHVFRVFLTRNHQVLCTGADSVFLVDPIRSTWLKTLLKAPSGELFPEVTSMTETIDGSIWMGTIRGIYGIGQDEKISYFISGDSSAITLKDPVITALCPDPSGNLWVGTINGLYYFQPESGKLEYIQDEHQELITKIWSIVLDDANHLWLSTNKGVFCLSIADRKLLRYTARDGLSSNEFVMGAHLKAKDGSVYFGSVDGVVRIDTEKFWETGGFMPKVRLTDVRAYGASVPFEEAVPYMSEIRLPYELKTFSVSYTSDDYTAPDRNLYYYRLVGYDDHWVYAGERREAFFTNLDPGHYTFEIKATNHSKSIVGEVTSVKIFILPPFYMTWWFRSLAVAIFILSIWLMIRYMIKRRVSLQLEKIEREKQIERERSRISKDMHDEVGSSLTKIAILSELATRDKEHSETHLHKITGTSREIIDSMGQIIWAINPQNDQLEHLMAYLREFCSELLEPAQVSYQLNFPDQLPELAVSAEYRRNIFLIIKESLNNAIKHSHASHIELSIEITGQTLFYALKDNGVGLPVEIKKFGNGLTNMKKRMEALGGHFEINNQLDGGVIVRFEVQLP